ncbi:MAG: coproporphyrinogen-III oxidase family protein, partial [Leptospirales bacterium]
DTFFLFSIFFGGGTPSVAPVWFISAVIEMIQKSFHSKRRNIEITMEANPEHITEKVVKELHKAGINRISLGVQSLSEKDLEYLERNAGAQKTREAIQILSAGPVENISADVIYAIPGQTTRGIENTLNVLLESNISHISAYSLTVAHDTVLNKMIEAGKRKKPSSAREYHSYKFIRDFLKENGYIQYEVSNYCLPGKKSGHNSLYWKYRPFAGLGPSAHSFVAPNRYYNKSEVEIYLEKKPQQYRVSEESAVWPELFIGTMRLCQPQGNSLFKQSLSRNEWKTFEKLQKDFADKGWMHILKNGFEITEQGILHSDTMLEQCANAVSF